MAKSMSIAATAFLAAGLWLRPMTAVPPVPAAATRSPGSSVHSVAGVGKSKPEGPWLASCKYWAAVRGMDSASKAKRPVTTFSCPIEPAGDDTRWGVPLNVGSLQPKIHVIIAAVPDPLHTHLALQFDRDIDALVQAAGDNGYVPSNYWLPWQSHAAAPPRSPQAGRQRIKTRFGSANLVSSFLNTCPKMGSRVIRGPTTLMSFTSFWLERPRRWARTELSYGTHFKLRSNFIKRLDMSRFL